MAPVDAAQACNNRLSIHPTAAIPADNSAPARSRDWLQASPDSVKQCMAGGCRCRSTRDAHARAAAEIYGRPEMVAAPAPHVSATVTRRVLAVNY